jgi:uncharacterized protein with FMN-binding domain
MKTNMEAFMKRIITACLILFLIAGLAFAQVTQQRFRNGNQTGTAASYDPATSGPNGNLTVQVTFRGNRITAIQVTQYTDTPAFMNMVVQSLIPAIIQAQSTNVDSVAGATYSSNGVKQAVNEAMNSARR